MIDFFFSTFVSIIVSTTLILNIVTDFLFAPVLDPGIISHKITATIRDETEMQTATTTPGKGIVATSTASTTPAFIQKSKATSTTTTKTANVSTSTTKTGGKNVTVNIPLVPAISVPPVTPSLTSVNSKVREALVNILCVTQNGGPLDPISGSGIIIDPSGIILTNAHVAEYLLLQNFLIPDYISCVARTGSPAVNRYTLELMYLSPQWIDANAHTLVETDPTGTGEHDFALFRIVGRTDPSEKVSYPLPYVAPQITEPTEGEGVLVAGYPAGFLGGISVQKDLYSASAVSTVKKIYTFDLTNETADLMSVGGTVVAQKGSSGGAVVNNSGSLIGLIVTSTDASETSARDLRAITIAHINRDLSEYAGVSLQNLLKSNTEAFARTFNTSVAPALTKKLINVLRGN